MPTATPLITGIRNEPPALVAIWASFLLLVPLLLIIGLLVSACAFRSTTGR